MPPGDPVRPQADRRVHKSGGSKLQHAGPERASACPARTSFGMPGENELRHAGPERAVSCARRSPVPADYDKIRAENITRYGTDTAVLDLLGQLYSDRTHFIFELIQNAEDAAATELAFELFDDRLEVRHDGRPFTEADVRAICGVGNSAKSAELTAIGAFGIGFKSVYAYTQTPRVHSPGEHFRIDNYVRPVAIPADGRPDETLFIFPFDRDDLSPAAATAEISAALADLGPGTLLFLRNIERVR